MLALRSWLRMPAGLVLLPVHALLLSQAVAQPPLDRQVDKALSSFGRKSADVQERILTDVRAATGALDNPYFVALRATMVDASKASARRAEALSERRPKKKPPKRGRAPDPGLPVSVFYVFGLGTIQPPGAAPRAPEKKRSAAARAAAKKRAAAVRKTIVHTALQGMLPESDHAVAAMLRRLDSDTAADRFAAFLQAWRNGEESFYEALDRTAGTEKSVFYFDVMLDDYVTLFRPPGTSVGEETLAARQKSLDAAHGSLHGSFLAYRQYRAFREAVALALVLPPSRPLPPQLSRYEKAPAGTYSLRDQVVMVLAIEGYDPLAVVDLIKSSAPPLPKPLWSAQYDPYTAWNVIFRERIEKMIAETSSTDAHLAKARAQLTAWSAEIVSATIASLAEAGIRIK